MHPGDHILFISHTFPPYRGIGGRRWAKFAKDLATRGYHVHVICATAGDDMKGSPWTADADHPRITRHELPMRYPKVLMKRPLTSTYEKLMYHFWVRILPFIANGNHFDKAVFWRSPMRSLAERILKKHSIQNIVVTGAPFLLLHHGLSLKKKDRNLIADFRDPWTWGHVYGQGTLGKKESDREKRMEREVIQGYDKVLCPADAMVDHLHNEYLDAKKKILRIPHAVDPDDLPENTVHPLADGKLRLIYAGSLYGAQEAELYFDEVLKAFNSCPPEVLERVQFDLYITGHDTAMYQQRVRHTGLADHIKFHQALPAAQIAERILAADMVLIFIPSINRDFMGTKFHEIFYMRRPLVHVGEVGDVSRFIIQNKLGVSLRVAELRDRLPKLLSREEKLMLDPDFDVADLTLAKVTDRLLSEVFR